MSRVEIIWRRDALLAITVLLTLIAIGYGLEFFVTDRAVDRHLPGAGGDPDAPQDPAPH